MNRLSIQRGNHSQKLTFGSSFFRRCQRAHHGACTRPSRGVLASSQVPSGSASLLRSSPKDAAPAEGPTIVWYKHDLRVHDHPGLCSTLASNAPVIAFFCFDPDVFSDQLSNLWPTSLLCGAVTDLRQSLDGLNCSLVVRQGSTEEQLLQLVASTGASRLVFEDEVEERWKQLVDCVCDGLPSSVTVIRWRTPIWAISTYSESFSTFRERRGKALRPLDPPASQQQATTIAADPGEVPAPEQWRVLLEHRFGHKFDSGNHAGELPMAPSAGLQQERGPVFADIEDILVQGETGYRAMLQCFLRGVQPGQWLQAGKRVLEVVKQVEAVPGNVNGSFTWLFQPALSLGMVSRRSVYTSAVDYESERNGGWLPPPLLWTAQGTAASKVAECGDFHVCLAHLLSQKESQIPDATRKFWRWNGQITDYLYADAGPSSSDKAIPILLVHGFGAFSDHWRRNIPDLQAKGYRVYACTIPGFGYSEKTPQFYSANLFAGFVRDFVLHVVGEPVVIAGNSIGGVVPTVACAATPSIFRGIVLINTAGRVDESVPIKGKVGVPPKRNPLLVQALSRLLFLYLQGGIAGQLKKLYPVRPFNADKLLNDLIYRASCDPCALQVFQSGFYLPPAPSVSFLLNEKYKGPVLVLQGVLDPLNDAQGRADALDASIVQASKVCIQAGHCPHDEVPELVNEAIVRFTKKICISDEEDEELLEVA